MAEKKKPPPIEDAEQSRRFLETARELETDGGLNPIDAEKALERIMRQAAPARRPTK